MKKNRKKKAKHLHGMKKSVPLHRFNKTSDNAATTDSDSVATVDSNATDSLSSDSAATADSTAATADSTANA